MDVLTYPETSKPYLQAFSREGIAPLYSGQAPLYFPSGKQSTRLMRERLALHCHDFYMCVPGVEYLSLKQYLWIALVRHHGRDAAMTIMPETFVLSAKRDLVRLTHKINQNLPMKMIAKGRGHNRKAVDVVNLSDLQNLRRSDGYVLVQELIACSDLLDGEIFNIRVYGIVNYFNGRLSGVVAREGKIIYSESAGNPITSNSVVKKDRLPRYTSQLFASATPLNETEFWSGVCSLFGKMVDSIADKVAASGALPNERFSQLVGLDIILDKHNVPLVLECNGRAQLRPTDAHDRVLKAGVFHDWVDSFLLGNSAPHLDWLDC